jgi:hypothetical protein
MVRIDLLKLHLTPGRKSTFMQQCRDVARGYKSSTTSEAAGQYCPGLYRLSIDLFGKVIDLKPLVTHTDIMGCSRLLALTIKLSW